MKFHQPTHSKALAIFYNQKKKKSSNKSKGHLSSQTLILSFFAVERSSNFESLMVLWIEFGFRSAYFCRIHTVRAHPHSVPNQFLMIQINNLQFFQFQAIFWAPPNRLGGALAGRHLQYIANHSNWQVHGFVVRYISK